MAFPRQQWLRERVSMLSLYVRKMPVLLEELTLTQSLHPGGCD